MENRQKPIIGFIGLGIMGKPMAKNLIKAGYELIVYNRSLPAIEELVQFGASAGKSSEQVAGQSDVIITMLPNSPDVESVILGKNGVLDGAQSGTIIIDMSSIEPLVSQKIALETEKKGVEFLDAPVSGGETGAIEGQLAIMVGGNQAAFDSCLNIFHALGKSVVRVGDVGAGGFAKLANQIIVALNIAAVSEAFVLGQKAGLNPARLFEAIRGGLAGSHVMDVKVPLIMDREFNPGFKIELHNKDIKNALKTAVGLDIPLPLTGFIEAVLSALIADGKGTLDHSAIIQFTEKLAHTEVRKDQ